MSIKRRACLLSNEPVDNLYGGGILAQETGLQSGGGGKKPVLHPHMSHSSCTPACKKSLLSLETSQFFFPPATGSTCCGENQGKTERKKEKKRKTVDSRRGPCLLLSSYLAPRIHPPVTRHSGSAPLIVFLVLMMQIKFAFYSWRGDGDKSDDSKKAWYSFLYSYSVVMTVVLKIEVSWCYCRTAEEINVVWPRSCLVNVDLQNSNFKIPLFYNSLL